MSQDSITPTMSQIKWLRLTTQMVLGLSLLSLAFFIFYTTHSTVTVYINNRHPIVNLEPSKTHPVATNIDQHKQIKGKNNSIQQVPHKDPKKPETNAPKTKTAAKTPGPQNATLASKALDGEKKNKTRYLIYLCDRKRSCGGWADRQRGFLAAYVMAIVTGRRFGLNMTYPCDIKLFYIPNKINWFIKVNEIRGLSWEIVDWMDNKNRSVDCESDFNQRHPSDVVFLKTNQDVIRRISLSPRYGHLVPDFFKKTIGWGKGWHQLMKPSFHMEEHIDMFMTKVPDKGDLVCAHLRMRNNPTIPMDGETINSLSTVTILWKFLSKYEKNASRIFIASDSLDVRRSARKWLGSKELDTDGLVLHVDRQGRWSDACLGFEMAILDQAILSRCKVLVMSASGFSYRAAMMSTKKQELYFFKNGTITKHKF